MNRKKMAIFCGSSIGLGEDYKKLARDVGKFFALNRYDLVYGGASIGVMGALADSALEHGAQVFGVIPENIFHYEIAHQKLTKLHKVQNMHQRKELMYSMSDAFLALPGGMGTLDEFCEIYTWFQLGYHQKPCGILNYKQFFSNFLKHLEHAGQEKFIKAEDLNNIWVGHEVDDLQAFI